MKYITVKAAEAAIKEAIRNCQVGGMANASYRTGLYHAIEVIKTISKEKGEIVNE